MSESAPEPRYPHTKWESVSALMVDLMLRHTPRPFWIQFEGSATRITDESAELISVGLRVASQMTEP